MKRTQRRRGKGTRAAPKKRARIAGTSVRAQVAAVLVEQDPRKRWQMEQHLAIKEMIRVAKVEGEAQARRDWELGRRTPSETMGVGEFVDLLLQHKQRSGG